MPQPNRVRSEVRLENQPKTSAPPRRYQSVPQPVKDCKVIVDLP